MTPSAPARFPKTARVRLPAQYRRVFENARRVHHPAFTLHVAPPAETDAGATLGLAVSRKVDPQAVGRNRIKRVMRDAFRQTRDLLAPGAYVLVARVPAGKATNADLRSAFLRLLQRAGALPVSPMGGTMPPAIPSLPSKSAAPLRRPSLPAR